MRRFVLDASAALGWFVDHPVLPIAARVRQSLRDGARALVPFFWHLEVANGLMVAERRGLISSDDANHCVEEIEHLLLSVIETRRDFVAIRRVIDLSRSNGIAPYDAIYLDLALSESIPLATLDRKLRTAAASAGINVIH